IKTKYLARISITQGGKNRMKKHYAKKGIVIAIIVLFIGISIAPIINANISREDNYVEITSETCGIIGMGEYSVKLTQQQNIELENLFDDINRRLDNVETREASIKIMNEAVVEFDKYGLLPEGMSVRQVQWLVTGGFLNSLRMKLFHRFPVNQGVGEPGNVNCLVIGRTDHTFFRPYPVLLFDFPRISPWLWNTSLLSGLLTYAYLFRILSPFRFSTYTYFGSRYRITEQGNVTYDDIYSSSGWVWTIGSSGVKKWNGSFYGDLYHKYKKIVSDNDRIWENWDCVGIDDFTGVNLNFLGKLEPSFKTFYVGFARQVSFNYSCPWL
ncbi:hypothetical protein KA005_75605, partial [bacterium]|nr:hypothetical protein [bacterium]